MARGELYPARDFNQDEPHPDEPVRGGPERRRCNDYGEEWTDRGDAVCVFCKSEDTELIEED